MRRALWLALLPLMAAPAFAGDNYATERNAVTLNPAQTQFVLRCGGCHGTLGVSPPRSVPSLKGVAGWFLCTPEGREYIIRLPNVSRAQFDDATLAGVMNFVTFTLGGASAPKGAARFTEAEVKAIRARPLNTAPLNAFRRRIVTDLIRRCHAPASLMDYGRRG
ncbi:MAG: cytochrome C [Sphingomonas sp.]